MSNSKDALRKIIERNVRIEIKFEEIMRGKKFFYSMHDLLQDFLVLKNMKEVKLKEVYDNLENENKAANEAQPQYMIEKRIDEVRNNCTSEEVYVLISDLVNHIEIDISVLEFFVRILKFLIPPGYRGNIEKYIAIGSQLEVDIRGYQLQLFKGRVEHRAFLGEFGTHNKSQEDFMGEDQERQERRIMVWNKLGEITELFSGIGLKIQELNPTYTVQCECGESASVKAVGPFNALKKIHCEIPIENPEAYGFWDHREERIMHSMDFGCGCSMPLKVLGN